MTKLGDMKIVQPTPANIEEAAKALRDGLLVAFPTETVYGLGASATNPEALRRLYAAKGRPADHPVIVHLADVNQIDAWASNVPDAARRIANALWPGPLTLILPRSTRALDAVTGGQNSVGIRIPNHPVAQALLKAFQDGVAAPSANKFGRLSPTSAGDVAGDFADEVSIIIDGGPCDVGIESTIVDFSGDQPRILRPGMVLPEQIEHIAGVSLKAPVQAAAVKTVTRAPGGLPSHYAPNTPLRIVRSEHLLQELEALRSAGVSACVLSFQGPIPEVRWITMPPNANRYAQQLYSSLRKLDSEKAEVILVESVPTSSEWAGVADRLQRASVTAHAHDEGLKHD
jgi:L-threonylcarbamoyladenylate synthase